MADNGAGGATGSHGEGKCAWIFAAGPEAATPAWPWLPRPQLVVCADGGLAHALALGIEPDIVVGDFDSVPLDLFSDFRKLHPQLDIRTFEHATKLETDAELALLAALEAGATEIVITGALGGRSDHSMANMLMLAHPLLARTPARIVTAKEEIFHLRGRSLVQVWGRPGDTVSLLPLADTAGISTGGLQYHLLEETLYGGLGRGVSNVLLRAPASVSQREGSMWVVVRHEPAALT